MIKKISQKKLIEVLKSSRKTLAEWKRQGLKCHKKKNTFEFEVDEVREWLHMRGKIDYLMTLNSYFSPPKKTITLPVEKLSSDKVINSQTIKIDLENFNIFKARELIGNLLTDIVVQYKQADPVEKSLYAKPIRELTEQLRKLEESCIEHDLKLKKVIPVSEIQKITGRLCNSIKNKLLNLPGAICEQLSAETEPLKVEEILRLKITSMLKSLSEGFKNGTI